MPDIKEEVPTWYELKKFIATLEGGQLGQEIYFLDEDGNLHTAKSVEINNAGQIILQ